MATQPFSVETRERVRERVLEAAQGDPRIEAGAAVGSSAHGAGDRWSDLDLTFAVRESAPILSVLDDLADILAGEFQAIVLFDLPSGSSLYRVFLLPGCLQVDLSVTPASSFAARGPKFEILFGSEAQEAPQELLPILELFAHAVHHLLRARLSIERGRAWQAEHWISKARDIALELACRREGLPSSYARGFDDLPSNLLEAARPAMPSGLDRNSWQNSLNAATRLLLAEGETAQPLAKLVAPHLELLTAQWEA